MNNIKTLFLSARPFIFSAIMGLFLQDPLILPEFDCYDDLDKHHKNHNILVLDDGALNPNKQDTFINELLTSHPDKCLLYTCSTDKNYIASVIPSGIGGIISQSAGTEVLRTGIISVAGGGRFYCDKIEKLLFDSSGTGKQEFLKCLTVREKEILFFTKEGKTSKEISQLFGISVKTVGRHKENIKSKLGLHRTNELYKI